MQNLTQKCHMDTAALMSRGICSLGLAYFMFQFQKEQVPNYLLVVILVLNFVKLFLFYTLKYFFFFPLLLGINKFIFSSTWKFPLNGIEMCSNNFCFAFYSFLCVKRTFPCQMGCSHKQTEATFAIGLPLPFSPLLLFIFTELSQ